MKALDEGIQVTWVYEIHRGVPTSFEPIEHLAPTDGFTWIDDALAFFNSGSGWDGTFALAQTVARNNSANWGIILFVVMNEPPIGKKFPNGKRAYAPVKGSGGTVQQGSFVVATFTGIHSDNVGQHELSHLFGAVDEEGFTPTCEDATINCSNTFGYLGFTNTNCQFCDQNFLCVMLLSESKYCTWSEGHIGWKDTDGDGAPDPIDPNSGRWMTVFPVAPGDRVVITQTDGDLVASFFVTENNSDDGLGTGFAVWDGQNFDNVSAGLGFYNVLINNDPPQLRPLNPGDPSVKPLFSEAGFWFDDSLRFKLGTSFANVAIVLKDSTGQVVGRPLWDKLFGSSATLVHAVDLSFLPDKTYTAEFTAWRPDGGLSNPFSISFIQYVCGDATNDGTVNVADVTALISFIFNGVPIDDPIERGDTDGNGSVNISDITYLMNYIFGDPNAPICSGVQQ